MLKIGKATSGILARFQFQGAKGAFFLGLAYGLLSGVCTFGFIAPILGIITLQKSFATGVAMLVLFGIGHCMPLAFCGIFSTRTMELLHSLAGQKTVAMLRKLATVGIAGLGIYFFCASFCLSISFPFIAC
jgi:cytochrome c-type biogenesis protein